LSYCIFVIIIFISIGIPVVNAESFPILIEHDANSNADETLVIYGSDEWRQVDIRQGFIHGIDETDTLSDSMISFLKPRFWRLFKVQTYEEAIPHGSSITFGPSNHYAWHKGGWENAKPWLDWDEYEAYILYVIQAIDSYFPDNPPDFYDIWSEPDHSYYWHGTYEQLVETFARTIEVIKTYKPDAKVVGPSISWYRPEGNGEENIIELLIDLDTIYGVRLDAISWHENGGIPDYGPGRPEDVYLDEASICADVEEYFPSDYTPEYHINEFGGGRVHLSPGWIHAYLFWLDYVGIDFASHACWNILSGEPPNYTDYWSDCWAGLDGLFMQDGFTPQPVYWVHRAYAEMDSMTQLMIGTTDMHVLTLAAKDDITETMRLLAGRYYDSTFTTVEFVIEDYPYEYDNVQIDISYIPSFEQFFWDPPVSMPWPDGPVHDTSFISSVTDDLIDFVINDFILDGVYTIDVNPYILCGDANSDESVNVSDAVWIINYVFVGGDPPTPIESGDVNCDGTVNVSDAVWIINYVFVGGNAPCDC